MGKTLGQLSYEVGQDATNEMLGGILDKIPWEDIGPELQEIHQATASAVRKAAFQEAIEAIWKEKEGFLSPQYATNQPVSSIAERFACNQCIEALQRLMADTDYRCHEQSEQADETVSPDKPALQTDSVREAE